jgi:hypothetical protein
MLYAGVLDSLLGSQNNIAQMYIYGLIRLLRSSRLGSRTEPQKAVLVETE